MKYCEKCGNKMADDSLFCSKCGRKVADAEITDKEEKTDELYDEYTKKVMDIINSI